MHTSVSLYYNQSLPFLGLQTDHTRHTADGEYDQPVFHLSCAPEKCSDLVLNLIELYEVVDKMSENSALSHVSV